MLKVIIEKEIKDALQSSKFITAFFISFVLILSAFVIGALNYKTEAAKYQAALSENLRQYEGVTDWFSVRNFTVFIPPSPLEILAGGVSNDIGRSSEIDGKMELSAKGSRYGEEPVFAVFRFLDLEFIFGIALSLFAILFAFDSINGEKEKGILRLTFANSLPRDKYLIGKFIGSFLALVVPLLIPILLGALTLILFGIDLTSDEWMKFAGIIGAGILYVASFLTLSLFMSSVTEKSSTSFLVLLVIWIFSILFIPRLSVIASGAVVDVPSQDEINSKKSRYMSQLFQEDRKKLSEFRATPGDDPSAVMTKLNKFMSENAEERQRKFSEFATRLNENKTAAENNLKNLALNIARISPYANFSLAVSELAGSSLALEKRFIESAKDYKIEFSNFVESKTGSGLSGGIRFRMLNDDEQEEKKPINVNEIPKFQMAENDINEAYSSAAIGLGALAAFNLFFFLAGFFSFRKFDLR